MKFPCLSLLLVGFAALSSADAQPPAPSAVAVAANVLEMRRAFSEPGPDREEQKLDGGNGKSQTLYLEKTPLLDQRAVKSASVRQEDNQAVLELTFTDAGQQSFAAIAQKSAHQQLGILVNGRLLLAPTVLEGAAAKTMDITGNFTEEEARTMAAKINSGAPKSAETPTETTFSASAGSSASTGVAIPQGQAVFLTSGSGSAVHDEDAPAGSKASANDTKGQAIGALRKIEAELKKAGLGLKDVIHLRVYLTPDKSREGKCDFAGWSDAYGQFFGTKENPRKPAHTAVGVASLANPESLIEIEAMAVYPEETDDRPEGGADAEKPDAGKTREPVRRPAGAKAAPEPHNSRGPGVGFMR